MDWINSGRLIVSNDSLGLHLGIALGKKVIGLFGPTPNKEVYFYGRGEAIIPDKHFDCLPCFNGNCQTGENCMGYISADRVHEEIKKLLKKTC
jgi:heptosyltransferase-2